MCSSTSYVRPVALLALVSVICLSKTKWSKINDKYFPVFLKSVGVILNIALISLGGYCFTAVFHS